MFALKKNYRSHQGILSLASQVMHWLWKGTAVSEELVLEKLALRI